MIDYEELIKDYKLGRFSNILKIDDDELAILIDLLDECGIKLDTLDISYPHFIYWMEDSKPHGKVVNSISVDDKISKFRAILSLQLEDGFMGFYP